MEGYKRISEHKKTICRLTTQLKANDSIIDDPKLIFCWTEHRQYHP